MGYKFRLFLRKLTDCENFIHEINGHACLPHMGIFGECENFITK